jgi:pyruvate ferredoxin oxidoreductase delta subunit
VSTDISKITVASPHQQLTEALNVVGGGTSKDFHTGEWRTATPHFIAANCKQCLLCAPTCPDSCIPVVASQRAEFELDYCKGCGICAQVCPFGAIEMKEGF